MKPFVEIDGKDKYQDFWHQLKDVTNESFHSDLGVLRKMQEELEKKLQDIQKEKERIFELIQILNSKDTDHEKEVSV
jgi:galactokinase